MYAEYTQPQLTFLALLPCVKETNIKFYKSFSLLLLQTRQKEKDTFMQLYFGPYLSSSFDFKHKDEKHKFILLYNIIY